MSHKVLLPRYALDLSSVLFNIMCFVFPFDVQIKCTQQYLQYVPLSIVHIFPFKCILIRPFDAQRMTTLN